MSCTGTGGTTSASTTATVVPAPTITLTASPTSIVSGSSTTLIWSTTDATACTASGGWSGNKNAAGGSQSSGTLTATRTYTLSCSGAGGNASASATVTVLPVPTVSLSASPTSVSSGGSSTLTWTSTNTDTCDATGAWSGTLATSGSQSTGALSSASTYTLTCSGAGGSASATAIVGITTPAPEVQLTVSPPTVASGGTSTLTWTSINATACTASGTWSGSKETAGSATTQALTAASNTFTLTCTGTGGFASSSATVTVSGAAVEQGLDFPGSAATSGTIRFRFTNPLAIYPATYIWRVYPRQQAGYYTTFFWGNDDGRFWWNAGTPDTFYGAHPYPQPPPSGTSHKWEIATDYGSDILSDEYVVYNRWFTQALVAWSDGEGKHTIFYYELPDTSKIVTNVASTSFGNVYPPAPALTFGDAPWNPSNEIMDGIIRGIQIYSTKMSISDVLSEIATPLSTSAGASNVWYMNLNPTPTDIADKSGKGHHPEWVGSERPNLWSNQ